MKAWIHTHKPPKTNILVFLELTCWWFECTHLPGLTFHWPPTWRYTEQAHSLHRKLSSSASSPNLREAQTYFEWVRKRVSERTFALEWCTFISQHFTGFWKEYFRLVINTLFLCQAQKDKWCVLVAALLWAFSGNCGGICSWDVAHIKDSYKCNLKTVYNIQKRLM